MEGAHGEVCDGFADGLSGDDADGFAQFDHAAGSEIAAVTERANAAAGFPGEHRTDAHAVDTRAPPLHRQPFGGFLGSVPEDPALPVPEFVARNAAKCAV